MCSKKEQILLFLERIILMGEHDGWIVHNRKRDVTRHLFFMVRDEGLEPPRSPARS